MIGASGSILMPGGIEAECYWATSGLVDPELRRYELSALAKALNLTVDMKELEGRAQEIEKIIKKIKEIEQQQQPTGPKDFTAEDKYIV